MENIKGVIFDLDGTLIDSMNIWVDVDREFFKKRKMSLPADYTKTIAPMGIQKAAVYTKNEYNLPESTEEIINEWRMSARKKYLDIELKDGAYEYLLYLRKKGIKLAVATASEEEMFVPLLKKYAILELFDNVTTLKEVSRGKGFPDIYELSAKKMNLKSEECLVFEDIYLGIKGAKDGNFKAICMKDAASLEDKEKIVEICDKYIESFFEMM